MSLAEFDRSGMGEVGRVLQRLQNDAAKGLMVRPESKFNSFRAGWLQEIVNRSHATSMTYFHQELKLMPTHFKEEARANRQ